MSTPLRLAVTAFGETPMLRLSGRLVFGQDLGAVHEAVTQLAAAGHHRLILDMTDVEATDSSGISSLLDVRHILGEGSGRIFLLRPSERLRGVLAVVRVTSLFEVVDDETELEHRLAK
jgi:anti-sigma B factor antagonist